MEKKPAPESNFARVSGLLQQLRQRWTPDGSLAVIAEVHTPRPQLGPVRAGIQEMQPMPIRATGKAAEALVRAEGRQVEVTGCLRRRYYSREGEPCWGQVEIWVESCHPLEGSDADRN
ncbi:MAG TPA: hypothetical protein VNI58_03405 [Mariprofundaceae bacterium]|nr:hypothetical protein [Mariprofundaceae bacterium]